MHRNSNNSGLKADLSRLLPASVLDDCRLEPVGGLTGESWRIRGDDIDWLARAVSAEKALLGADGRREYRILRHLGASGLAPRPILLTPRWSVVAWVGGASLTSGQWRQCFEDGSLVRLLRQLHHLPRYGYPLTLHTRYARYWQSTDPARHSPAWLRLHRRLMAHRTPVPLKTAPLHMDLHAANLVRATDGSLRFIDWEYAVDGDIALELAALFQAHAVGETGQAAFLAAYQPSGGYPLSVMRRQVAAWRPWVDYLMLLWYEVRWAQTGRENFLREAIPLRRSLGLPA